MGYLEHRWLFSDQQAINADGFTNSERVVDLQTLRDLGRGQTLYVHAHVVEAFAVTGGTNPSLTIIPVYATDANLSNPIAAGTTAQLYVKGAGVNLTLDSHFYLPISPYQYGSEFTIYDPDGSPTLITNSLQFFGIRYSFDLNGGTAVTAGKVTTRLTLDQPAIPPVYPASTDT